MLIHVGAVALHKTYITILNWLKKFFPPSFSHSFFINVSNDRFLHHIDSRLHSGPYILSCGGSWNRPGHENFWSWLPVAGIGSFWSVPGVGPSAVVFMRGRRAMVHHSGMPSSWAEAPPRLPPSPFPPGSWGGECIPFFEAEELSAASTLAKGVYHLAMGCS